MLTVARGFTAFGLASEEDLQKVAQGIVTAQGALDSFSGTADSVIGIIELFRSIRAAAQAGATANTALALNQA